MVRYISRRFYQSLISLLILAVIIFLLARASGNPVDIMLPSDASIQAREAMIKRLGLDKPYHEQFIIYMSGIARGDFGESLNYRKPNLELFATRFPKTLQLSLVAFAFATLIAVPLGVIAGSNRNSKTDSSARIIAVIGMSAPSFWIGLFLMQVFAVYLGWLPAARTGTPLHFILPAFSLSFFMLAGITRMLRSSMIENIDSEWAKLAHIKGVARRIVIWKHCLRNSLIPVMTFAGVYLGALLVGSVVIESVFAWPGVGRMLYGAIRGRDYPLMQTIIIIKGAIIIGLNLFVDIMYAYVDPRIRYK
ncbi:ABC transporter permease [Chloroflexota bacterium]